MVSIRKHDYQAWLVPHAEGTLDAARVARLEAQMARDPELSEEAQRVRAVTAQLRRAAALSTAEADLRLALDPAPLWPNVQERLAARPRRLPRPMWWAGGACAASLALAALLLHGPLSGIGTRQMPPSAPVRTANAGGASLSTAQNAVRARHKKAGHRLYARPTRLAFSAVKPLPPARPAAHFPVPPPALTPALPASAPGDAAPSARTAVALGDGSGHFRLASPVPDALPIPRARPAAAPDERTSPDAPTSDKTAPPLGDSTETQARPAPDTDTAASTPAAPPLPTASHSRKSRSRHPYRRHHFRHQAVPVAAPASESSPAAPAAAPLGPRNPRVL